MEWNEFAEAKVIINNLIKFSVEQLDALIEDHKLLDLMLRGELVSVDEIERVQKLSQRLLELTKSDNDQREASGSSKEVERSTRNKSRQQKRSEFLDEMSKVKA